METENQESTITTRSVGLRYGLIMAAVSILYFVTLIVANVNMTEGIGRWGSTIFYIAIIFLAQKYFKDNGSGYMRFGEGMGITFWIGAVSSVLSSIFTFVYMKFIDKTFAEQLLDKQREAMEGQGLSEDQIDQAMTMTAKFMTPEMMLGFGIFFGIIFILIVGLIVTIFTQKRNPEMPV